MASDDFHDRPPPSEVDFIDPAGAALNELDDGFWRTLFCMSAAHLRNAFIEAVNQDDSARAQTLLMDVFGDVDHGTKILVEVLCRDVWVYVIFNDAVGVFSAAQRAKFTDDLFIWLSYAMRFVHRQGRCHEVSVTRYHATDTEGGTDLRTTHEDLASLVERYHLAPNDPQAVSQQWHG